MAKRVSSETETVQALVDELAQIRREAEKAQAAIPFGGETLRKRDLRARIQRMTPEERARLVEKRGLGWVLKAVR